MIKSSKSLAALVVLLLSCCLLFPAVLAAAPDEVTLPVAGDLLTFGRYEQDDNLRNGPEPITWLVLAVEGGKALLISQKCLVGKPYNTKEEAVTWETCTLRAWLNADFLNAAFTADEQKAILTTAVTNEDNPYNGTDGGNDTSDKVFLLSIAEAERLFTSDEERRALNTPYAVWHGAGVFLDGFGCWWLRSPGIGSDYAACMDPGGSGFSFFFYAVVNDDIIAVRPALYIGLGANQ